MRYLYNLLVAIDQLGNAICAGNPDCTISARVGYSSIHVTGYKRIFWKRLEQVIDFTFWPLQGKGHCQDAYSIDAEDTRNNYNHDWARWLMSIIIVITCIPISIGLYTIWGIRYVILPKK